MIDKINKQDNQIIFNMKDLKIIIKLHSKVKY